ncbi:MAG: O-antigen ligase family protein [Patescibacteria group bacterium]
MIIEIPLLYLLLPLILLAWLAWRNLPSAVAAIVLLAPSYLIKSSIGIIPTTFLELVIYITMLVCLIKYFTKISAEDSFKLLLNKLRPLSLIIACWLLAASIAVVVSPDLRLSLGVLKGWFIDPVIFLGLLVSAIKTPKDWLKVLTAFWSSASLLAAYGLIEYGFGWGLQSDNLLNSVYQPANYLAMYLVPAIFVGAALIRSSWPSYFSKLNLLILVIDLWALYLTKSYGGFLALVLGAAVFIWFALSSQVKLRRRIFLCFLVVIVVGGFVIAQQPKFQKLLTRDPRSSLTTRQEIWQTAWILIKEQPVVGWGLGNFQESYRSHVKYITLTPLEWQVVRAHNLYLNLWIEVGLLGLLVFIYLVIKYLWQLVPDLKSNVLGRRLWASALVAIIVATLIHGLVDTPYFKNDLSLVFFLVIGAGLLFRYYSSWSLEMHIDRGLTKDT